MTLERPGFATDALLLRVGERVRKARRAAGLSRRSLSDQSGVSQRYLAQLEGGSGNISISLLNRVATALNLPLETLVATDESPLPTLFQAADPATQAQVMALLQPAVSDRAERICLIGLRGAGKSTLGAAVSQALNIPFLELNDVIAQAAGMPVAEIMALYGAEGYRRLEADAVEQVITGHNRLILAAAGGIVGDGQVYKRLLERFHTIWLRAAPDDHMNRVRAQGDTRPMAGNPRAMIELTAILKSREDLYARANAALETSGKSLDTSTRELADLIQAKGFAPPFC